MDESQQPWFAVRCVVCLGNGGTIDARVFEERITLWRAASFEEAIERAESEAHEYASDVGGEATELVQAFRLFVGDEITDGTEVFSLIRNSKLEPDEYIDRFFDTGDERQGRVD